MAAILGDMVGDAAARVGKAALSAASDAITDKATDVLHHATDWASNTLKTISGGMIDLGTTESPDPREEYERQRKIEEDQHAVKMQEYQEQRHGYESNRDMHRYIQDMYQDTDREYQRAKREGRHDDKKMLGIQKQHLLNESKKLMERGSSLEPLDEEINPTGELIPAEKRKPAPVSTRIKNAAILGFNSIAPERLHMNPDTITKFAKRRLQSTMFGKESSFGGKKPKYFTDEFYDLKAAAKQLPNDFLRDYYQPKHYEVTPSGDTHSIHPEDEDFALDSEYPEQGAVGGVDPHRALLADASFDPSELNKFNYFKHRRDSNTSTLSSVSSRSRVTSIPDFIHPPPVAPTLPPYKPPRKRIFTKSRLAKAAIGSFVASHLATTAATLGADVKAIAASKDKLPPNINVNTKGSIYKVA